MGGAVTLLLVATMGITFGWTPDGADGVKYIIQVPPDQLDQLERVGEITSTISPEVRGRVSEIVIRVGTGSVPRETPAHWNQTNASHPSGVSQVVSDENALRSLPIASDDRRPIPIPMTSNSTQPRIIPGNVNSPSVTRLMKPQSGGMNLPGGYEPPAPTTGPSTSGFNMPPSLAQGGAASTPGTGVPNTGAANTASLNDTLRAEAEAFAEATRRNLGLGMPSTASNDPAAASRASSTTVAPPPFTGGNTAYSGTTNPNAANPYTANPGTSNPATMDRSARNGGPSTAPTSASTGSSAPPWPNDDDDWYALGNRPASRPSTAPATNPTNGSLASDPGAAPRTGADPSNRNSPNSAFNTGNFNQMPGGLGGQNPFGQTASDSLATPSSRRDTTYATSSQGDANTIQRYEYDPKLTPAEADRLPPNGWSFNTAGIPVDREGYLLNAYGERVDQNGRPLSNSAYANESNRSNPSLASNPTPNRSQSSGMQSNGAPTNGNPGYGGNATYASQQGSNPGQTNQGQANPGTHFPNYAAPNTGNSNTVPPNTGNPNTGPLFANGQQPAAPMPNAGQPQSQYPYGQNYTPPQIPYAPTNSNPANPNINPATGYPYQYVNFTPNANNPGGVASNTSASGGTQPGTSNAGPPPGRGEGSLDDKDALGSAISQDPRADREKVATQTLFNALLLVSFVANLYLMYWLNVLRLKYQEMVAAKRAAASANSAAVA
ncbi:Basic proline-rich protein [Rhodopirellula islandica]|uniref:Basic proline-rich protein n=1 Tax=Rhodopirellula islandica TaxID=595434 RepID=A0A0J1BDA5_RHOIS|nr:mu-protocadherin [Rhodopirellula islandica]KLU04471.1 Basic proline-rich protein [Rhodopirellula islandica]